MRALIFGGATEGRTLSQELAGLGAAVTVCVATAYGKEEQGELSGVQVRTGRLDEGQMCGVIAGADVCIDATHPYAVEASRNIRAACERTGVRLLRLLREESGIPAGAAVFSTAVDAAAWLRDRPGNILLAIGAKELWAFAGLGGQRLYPRVLPLETSLNACAAAGVPRSNILALQGPFTQELNEALIRQFHIRFLVTKDGGQAGGFGEKAAAAASTGAQLVLIRRPEESGLDYGAVLEQCREMMECR